MNRSIFQMLICLWALTCTSATAQPQPSSRAEPCADVITTLYPEWHAKLPRETLPRIEIRNCRLGDWGILQIAAYRAGSGAPDLVVDTARTTVVKCVMARKVFILETAGASSNVVQVVTYDNGVPRLALSEAIRAYSRIQMSWKSVTVGLPQEDGSERKFEFATGID